MDPIVSAITHRTLQPAPAAKPPAGPQHAQQAAAERAGSRLGGTADSQLAAGDATPGGLLSANPSTQSLQGLLGGPASAAGGLGGGTEGPAVGGEGAARAALAAHQTVERRRLDLDSLNSPHVVLTSAGMRRQQQMAASSSEEEAEAGEAVAAASRGAPEEEPSSAPQSSLLRSRGGSDAGLACAASVDLIDAPVSMEENEQAELIS